MAIDKKFIVKLQGSSFITYEGLLSLFHENGGKSIKTNIISTDPLIFQATVEGENGTYQGVGDANDDNVNRMIAKHKIRMAETRAIARALRWYNNIGMCSADEMGGESNKNETGSATVNETGEDDKPWFSDKDFERFKPKYQGNVKMIMKGLRTKFKVAKKYEPMIQDYINKNGISLSDKEIKDLNK